MFGMAFVDRLGRKPLLHLGSLGLAACLVTLAVAMPHHFISGIYLSILVAYNAFFAFSLGAVVWVYLSELFPLLSEVGAKDIGRRFIGLPMRF
jgi:MFS family permease